MQLACLSLFLPFNMGIYTFTSITGLNQNPLLGGPIWFHEKENSLQMTGDLLIASLYTSLQLKMSLWHRSQNSELLSLDTLVNGNQGDSRTLTWAVAVGATLTYRLTLQSCKAEYDRPFPHLVQGGITPQISSGTTPIHGSWRVSPAGTLCIFTSGCNFDRWALPYVLAMAHLLWDVRSRNAMCCFGRREDRIRRGRACGSTRPGKHGRWWQRGGGPALRPETRTKDRGSSACGQGPFDVGALFLGIGFHAQEGTAPSLSPACQTTTEKLTINLNT